MELENIYTKMEIKNTNKKEKEKEKINNKFEGLNDEELKKLRDKLLVERNEDKEKEDNKDDDKNEDNNEEHKKNKI